MSRAQAFVPDFWAEACQATLRNVCTLLRAAGEPVTREKIELVLWWMPRDPADFRDEEWMRKSFCWACLDKLARKEPVTEEVNEVANFFALRVPRMRHATLRMLAESITGALRAPRGAGMDPPALNRNLTRPDQTLTRKVNDMTGICMAICTCCVMAVTACMVRSMLAEERRSRWWFSRKQRQAIREDERAEKGFE